MAVLLYRRIGTLAAHYWPMQWYGMVHLRLSDSGTATNFLCGTYNVSLHSTETILVNVVDPTQQSSHSGSMGPCTAS